MVKEKMLVVALLAALVLMSVPLYMRATTAYPRYFMPLALPLILCFAIATTFYRTYASRILHKGALEVVIASMAVVLVHRQIELHAPSKLVDALRAMPQLHPRTKIFVPEDASTTYVWRLPNSTYARISSRAKMELNEQEGITTFLQGHAFPQKAIKVLVNNFNEDEQAKRSPHDGCC